MVINKKITRTMRENKAPYLGSLILIIISCMLFTMYNQLSINMVDISSSFEKNYVQEDASFIADKKLPDLKALEDKLNMKIEETRTLDYHVSESKTLRIFSENNKVNIPAILKGEGLKDKGILLDPGYAKANKLDIGDSIKIYGTDYKIAGFMSLPNYIYPIKQESDIMTEPNTFGVAVITKANFNKLNKGYSSYAIKFNNSSNLDDQIAEFKDNLKNEGLIILGWTNISENPRVTSLEAKLQGIDKMRTGMPMVILLLTCVLTGIVIWRMVKKEFVIIGTLYAMGYRKREIMVHYLVYPLSIALIGGIIGTILGAFTLRPMLEVMISYFNMPVDVVVYEPKYVVISILLPVVLLALSGYLVVNKGLKYSPVELMRGGRDKGKVGFLERRLKLDKLKFSTKFKVREQLRSLPRSAFLLFGVVFATMLLLMGFTAKSSMDLLMKDTYENTIKYNYMYVFNTLQKGTPEKGEAFSELPVALKSDSKTTFTIFGISPDSKYILLKDKAGNKLSTSKVIITRALAKRLNAKAGDTIRLVNKLDSREYSIKVDEIAETYVGGYMYMPLNKFNSIFKYPAGSYIGLYSKEKLTIPENKLFTSLTVNDLKEAFSTLTAPIQAYIGVIAFISFIIGLIVIYVVTSMIIEENKVTISLMKVVGYRKKEVYSLILNSSFFIIVLGFIIGVPLILKSMDAMYSSVTKSMNFSLPVTINYSYVLVGFAIIYFTFEITKFFSRNKINRISMTEALKAGME